MKAPLNQKVLYSTDVKEEDIKNRECKFVLPLGGYQYDWHLAKEKVTMQDGSTFKRIALYKNYQRPIWLTKTNKRNYQQSKEREKIENTDKYLVTRLNEIQTIADANNEGYKVGHGDPRDFYKSPYVYGTDLSHASHLKMSYRKRFPQVSFYDVAVFDIETDMFSGDECTIIATLSFKDKVVTTILKDYIKGIADVENTLRDKFHFYLDEYVKNRNIQWEIKICDTPAQCIEHVFKRAHEWKPDFVSIWNIDFDIPHVTRDLERDNIDPKDIFSDPFLPPHLRHFKYNKGPDFMVTKKGVRKPYKPAEKWHWVDTPASFYFIDSMQVYYQIRKSGQNEPSYALDYILNKELGIRKLKFKEADHIPSGTPPWHRYLQKNFKLEYIIYNVFDCISVEMLDEKTFDLALSMPEGGGNSSFKDFNSNPKCLWDDIYPFMLDRGYVPGNKYNIYYPEFDDKVIDGEGWIVALPAHHVMLRKSNYYQETNSLYTKIRVHCADLDISAAYPSNGMALNMSRETTVKDLVEIIGVDEETRRSEGLNLSGGRTNAVSIMTNLFKCPSMYELLDHYDKNTSPAM